MSRYKVVQVLGSELRFGVKKKTVSNRKQKVVGIRGWERRGTGVWFQTPSGNLAAQLGI